MLFVMLQYFAILEFPKDEKIEEHNIFKGRCFRENHDKKYHKGKPVTENYVDVPLKGQ